MMSSLPVPIARSSRWAQGLTWVMALVVAYLALWVSAGAWSVLLGTVTSEATGQIMRRAILVPAVILAVVVAGLAIHFLISRYAWTHRVLFGFTALLALGLRLAWIILVPTRPVSDFLVYSEMAVKFAAGQFTERAKPFGYPLLLSVAYRFSPTPDAGRLLNVLFGVMTVILVYWAAQAVTGKGGGLLAMLCMALSPSEIFMSSVLGTEVATETFVFGAVAVLLYLLYKNERFDQNLFFIPGLILGVGVAIRPSAFLIAFVMILFVYMRSSGRLRAQNSLRMIAGAIVLPLIVILWSSFEMHRFSLNSLFYYGSFPLLAGTNIQSGGGYNLADVNLFYSIPPAQRSSEVLKIVFERLTGNPISVIAPFIAGKIHYLLTDNLYGSAWAFLKVDLPLASEALVSLKQWLDVVAQSWYFLAILGTGLSLLWSLFKKDFFWVVILGVVIAAILPHVVLEVQPRYHHMLLPFFALACGYLFWNLEKIKIAFRAS